MVRQRKGETIHNTAERELELETAYLERAEQPMKAHEISSKAFNLLWIDFFKTFSMLAGMASMWLLGSALFGTASATRNEDVLFAVLTLHCFVQARRWLGEVNVAMQVSEDTALWSYRSFTFFLIAVLLQLALPMTLVLINAWEPSKCAKRFFPTGLVFFTIAVSAVAYMRRNVKDTERFRRDYYT